MIFDSNDPLNEWLEMLRSPNLDERLVAVKTLQHLGDEAAIEPLILALQDRSTAVQKLAITALRELADPAAVSPLIDCLGSPDEEVRTEALAALGELVALDDLLILLDALQRDDLNVQLSVLILLRKIHDVQALPYILPFLESEKAKLREAGITTLCYLNQVKTCPPALALLSDPVEIPPGTGDAQITIVQESPICGVIIVTTPQQVAVSDVRRSIHMFRRVGVPVLGIIENMSYLACQHCGEHTPIFGSGGGEQVAAELQAPLLGKIPLDPRICNGGDVGQPMPMAEPDSLVAQVFMQIATALNTTFSSEAQLGTKRR